MWKYANQLIPPPHFAIFLVCLWLARLRLSLSRVCCEISFWTLWVGAKSQVEERRDGGRKFHRLWESNPDKMMNKHTSSVLLSTRCREVRVIKRIIRIITCDEECESEKSEGRRVSFILLLSVCWREEEKLRVGNEQQHQDITKRRREMIYIHFMYEWFVSQLPLFSCQIAPHSCLQVCTLYKFCEMWLLIESAIFAIIELNLGPL